MRSSVTADIYMYIKSMFFAPVVSSTLSAQSHPSLRGIGQNLHRLSHTRVLEEAKSILSVYLSAGGISLSSRAT